MTISLEAFKTNTLGGMYGKPRLEAINDRWYLGHPLSYVRQYMEQVQGVRTKNYGTVGDLWLAKSLKSLYDRITDQPPQDGDIVLFEDGHIAIAYKGDILSQNYRASGKVTINEFELDGYLGALRLKGKQS